MAKPCSRRQERCMQHIYCQMSLVWLLKHCFNIHATQNRQTGSYGRGCKYKASSWSSKCWDRPYTCKFAFVMSIPRQKKWRSPFRKRAVNLRKTWHLLKFTGVHESENPRFSSCFAVGELEYSFHYPVVFHYGEQRKTHVYWNLPVG